MKRLILGLIVLTLLLLGTAFIVPSLIPSETYKTHIEAQLNKELGRDVTINGDVKLSTFPVIKAVTGPTTISNPAGFSRDHLASLQGLEARIKLWPLFSRRIEIASFNLINPDIHLERLPTGQVNWTLEPENAEVEPGAAPASTVSEPFARDGRYSNIDPSIGSFRIVDGRVHYQDRQNDVEHVVEQIDIRLTLPDMTDQLSLSGDMRLDGEPVTLDVLLDSPRQFLNGETARFSGDVQLRGVSLTADGQVPPGAALGFDGKIDARISDTALIEDLLPEPIPALELVDNATLSAQLQSKDTQQGTQFTELTIGASGDSFEARFSGSGAYLTALSVDGTYRVDATDLPTILSVLAVDHPDRDLVKRASAEGQINWNGTTFSATNTVADLSGDGLSANLSGTVRQSGEAIRVDGAVIAEVASLANLNNASQTDIPYADLVQKITLSGNFQGEPQAIDVTDLQFTMTDGDLNGTYQGAAMIGDQTSLDGTINITVPSLRKIAATVGTPLPPSTDQGPIFEAFALDGRVDGTLEALSIGGVTLSLDDITASGDFGFALSGERPMLTGQLSTSKLDVRPYMAAYSTDTPSGPIPPWSEAPLPTDSFNAIDARLTFDAEAIILSRLRLGPTQADVTLSDGKMVFDVPRTQLYGGSGRANLILDGSGETVEMELTAGLNDLEAQGFLGAVAGLTQATGTAETMVSLQGAGLSQAEIMQSLTGNSTFQILDGSIRGIDATEFMTGLQQAFTSRSLPGGIGPEEITKFRDLVGGITLVDGVAQIQSFKINAQGVQLEGAGQVDLGEQTVDIRLRPKAVGPDAKGLAAFGIPIRIKGPFGASVLNLDTDFLGQVLQARAAQEAQSIVSDRLGDTAGGVLGSILGSTRSQNTTGGQEAEPRGDRPPAEQDEVSDDDDDAEADPDTPEEKLENSLRDLFGVKRRD
jgi:AsmA protein